MSDKSVSDKSVSDKTVPDQIVWDPAQADTTTEPVTRSAGRRPNLILAAMVAVALAAPLFVDSFWLQLGVFAIAAAVAALGLGLLLGQAGQLSLGHSFFVAVGAYGYTFMAAGKRAVGAGHEVGLALPTPLAVVLAVLLTGLAGLLFSPIAARLRGIYLGIATLGLVFAGQHVLFNAESLTGGFNGRNVPDLFGTPPGETLYLLGVPLGREQKLWYVGLAALIGACLYYRNLVRSRHGRALRAVRERELMAGIIGVPVTRYKGYAFLISSMYAGLGGVLLALAFGRIVPETFGITLGIEYLAMVVIGGLGTAAGAVIGAVFVSCLPPVLERYAAVLPGVAPTGSEGLSPAVAARWAYGIAIILLLLLEPGGAVALGGRLSRALRRFTSPRHS